MGVSQQILTAWHGVDLEVSCGTSGSDRIWRAFYHVTARGNRRERIFRDEADRLLFYQTLGEACVLPLLLSAPHHRGSENMGSFTRISVAARESVAFSFKVSNLSLISLALLFSVF